MPKISVIVPIYNVEKYLEKCINSIILQTLEDIEIILVNDGSTDKSFEIINKYKAIDSRIIVINKINSGLSAARNSGLKVARGEYVGFIDSDDWIEENMLEELYEAGKKYNSEVVACNFKSFNDINNTFNKYPINEGKYIGKLVINEKILSKVIEGKLKTPVWDKIYKKKFLQDNKIKFDEKIIRFEDWHFIVEVYEKVNNLYYLDKNMYNYRIYSNTLSNKYYDNFFELIIELNKRKFAVIEEKFKNKEIIIKNAKFNYIDDINKVLNHIMTNGKRINMKKKIFKIEAVIKNDFTKGMFDIDINEYIKVSDMNKYYIKVIFKLIKNEKTILVFLFLNLYLRTKLLVRLRNIFVKSVID